MPSSSLASLAISPSITPITSLASTKAISRSNWVNSGWRSAEVLIAETPGDLHVTIVAGDHQDLLVKLRRLGQGIEHPRLNPAGHEIVARPFRRAPPEHRGLDVDEPKLVEVVADEFGHPVPQDQGSLHLGPAEVEKPVFQTQVLARLLLGARLHWRDLALVQYLHAADTNLDLTGRQVGVLRSGRPSATFPVIDTTSSLRSLASRLQVRRLALRCEHNLGLAVSIAEIDEQSPAVVAIGIDPSTDGHLLANMVGTQLAASMSSEQRRNP